MDWKKRARVHIRGGFTSNAYDIAVVAEDDDGFIALSEGGWELVESGTSAPLAVNLSREAVQQLADDLWGMGLRPTGWAHEGQIEATQAHISDLRRFCDTETLRVDHLLRERVIIYNEDGPKMRGGGNGE